MKLHALLLLLGLFAFQALAAEPSAKEQVRLLNQRYAAQDKSLPNLRRSAQTIEKDGRKIREESWTYESGEVVKILREDRKESSTLREEFSFDLDGNVYFAFQQSVERPPAGGARVTETRSHLNASTVIARTRRALDLPAGAEAVIPEKTPSETIDVSTLNTDERADIQTLADEIRDRVSDPKFLVHDPAKGAPAEWLRIKLMKKTISPDGRYALALGVDKKDFSWESCEDRTHPATILSRSWI